jgi:hypothetical protein
MANNHNIIPGLVQVPPRLISDWHLFDHRSAFECKIGYGKYRLIKQESVGRHFSCQGSRKYCRRVEVSGGLLWFSVLDQLGSQTDLNGNDSAVQVWSCVRRSTMWWEETGSSKFDFWNTRRRSPGPPCLYQTFFLCAFFWSRALFLTDL